METFCEGWCAVCLQLLLYASFWVYFLWLQKWIIKPPIKIFHFYRPERVLVVSAPHLWHVSHSLTHWIIRETLSKLLTTPGRCCTSRSITRGLFYHQPQDHDPLERPLLPLLPSPLMTASILSAVIYGLIQSAHTRSLHTNKLLPLAGRRCESAGRYKYYSPSLAHHAKGEGEEHGLLPPISSVSVTSDPSEPCRK